MGVTGRDEAALRDAGRGSVAGRELGTCLHLVFVSGSAALDPARLGTSARRRPRDP